MPPETPTLSITPAPKFFRALELQRTRALVERDMPVLEELQALDYHLITPAGKVFSRERYFSELRSGPFYTSWHVGEMTCRIAPLMTVIRYLAKLSFPSGSQLFCWHTDSYEFYNSRWQAVWSQATAALPSAAK